MNDKIFNIIIKLSKQGGADVETVKGLKDIKDAIVSGTAVVGTMVAAYYTLDQGLKATVGKLVTYAAEVKNLQTITGNTAEDTSRLLTITKDYGVTVADLTMAQKTLSKTGESLSTETLARMSDEFLALGTGAEKTRYLIDNFGRSGADLATFLSQGSEALLKMADGVQKNLVLDDQMITEAQKLKLQQAELNDEWDAAEIGIGRKVVPSLISLIDYSNKYNETISKQKTSWMQYVPILSAGYSIYNQIAMLFQKDLPVSIKMADTELEKWNGQIADTELEKWNGQLADTARIAATTQPVLSTYFDKIANNYDFLISGARSYDDYTKKISDEEATLGSLRKQGWGETSQKIIEAKEALSGYIAEQSKAEGQALLDVIQKAWGENMTPEQEATLLAMQVKLGLISQAGADAYQHIYDLGHAVAGIPDDQLKKFRFLIGLEGIDQAITDMQELRNTAYDAALFAWDALNGIQPVGNPYPEGSGAWEKWNKTHGIGLAGGGSGVVPPGYPNDNYMIGLSSGERFTVTPAGGVTNNNYSYSGAVDGGVTLRELQELNRNLLRLPEQIGTELDKRMK